MMKARKQNMGRAFLGLRTYRDNTSYEFMCTMMEGSVCAFLTYLSKQLKELNQGAVSGQLHAKGHTEERAQRYTCMQASIYTLR